MWFYQIIIKTYWIIASVYALFNKKAKQFISGRKNVFQHLKDHIPSGKHIIWIHCASLGEFEQGRPVIDQLKKASANNFILLTFFSPSGYQVRKNYPNADCVTYLPIDTKKNARHFINAVKPAKAMFVKYEFWLNYIDELYHNNIPIYLISGVFRKKQHFFQWYGKLFKNCLEKFSHFYLQDETSATLLSQLGISNHTVTGDTRFDRVNEISKNVQSYSNLDDFSKEAIVILAGSSWPAGEKLLARYYSKYKEKNLKLIIAPHQVDDAHIREIENLFPEKPALWTKVKEQPTIHSTILIIDTIGILSSLYQYADIAYIGGGFGKGIHNTLEAATFSIPVIFGPNHKKFREAVALKKRKAAFAVNSYNDMENILNQLIRDNSFRQETGENAGQYVQSNAGATKIILNSITKKSRDINS